MKHLKLFFVLAFIICTGLLACKKEENLTKTELLSKQSWILRAYTSTRLSDGVVVDAYAPMSDCYKDDQYVYNANMTYEGNAGATKCSAADPQVFSTGSWQFKNNETVLERTIVSGIGIGTTEFEIVSLSTHELSLRLEDGSNRHELRFSH